MNVWYQRVLREWLDDKWGGVPAFIWDVSTVLFGGIIGGWLGFLWAVMSERSGLYDAVVVGLWVGAGLLAGWIWVVIRRPS